MRAWRSGNRCLCSLASLGLGARFAVCWCRGAGALLCMCLWCFPVLACGGLGLCFSFVCFFLLY